MKGLKALTIGLIFLLLTACNKKNEENLVTITQVSPEGRYERFVFEDFEVVKDVEYKEGHGFDVRIPKNDDNTKRPAIVFVHGGGMVSGDKDNPSITKSMSEEFAKMGYVTFNVNYSLGQTANETTFRNGMEDLKSAIQYIAEHDKDYGIDSEKISVCGYSSGAELAINLCYSQTAPKVAAVVDISGQDLYYGGMKNDVPPCLVIHGKKDATVSFEKSEGFYKKVSEHNKASYFLPLENAGHNLDIYYEQIRNEIGEFLYKQLMNKEVEINIHSDISIEYQKVLNRMENETYYNWANKENAIWLNLDKIKDIGTTLPDEKDFLGKVKIWTDGSNMNKLYITALVTDDEIKDTVEATGKWYNDDCFEIIIDTSANKEVKDLLKWVVGATGDDMSLMANADNTQCVVNANGTEYQYEIVIELPFDINEENVYGINICYNDCDNGKREHQLGFVEGKASDRSKMLNLVCD